MKDAYIRFSKNNQIKISELMFFIGFSVYLTVIILNTTMFNVYIKDFMWKIATLSAIIMCSVKMIFFDNYSLKNLFKILIIFITIFIASVVSGYSSILYLAIFIIASKDVSFRKIVKIYFYITLIIVLGAMLCERLGIIEQIIYYRNGRPRYAFGSIYCTDFAAHIFYLILSYCYIKGKRINFIDILIFIMLAFLVNYYNGARLDSICIFGVALYFTYLKIKQKILKRNDEYVKIGLLSKYLLVILVPMCAIVSLVVTNSYNSANNLTVILNNIFNHRLELGKKGIEMYGLKLFGQQVAMNGYGGTNNLMSKYFFIDNSYVHIALRYGVVILFVICIYFMCLNYRILKNNNIFIPIIIGFIAINSLVAHHFIDLSYNPFILCFFTNIDSDCKLKKIKYKIIL